MTTIRSTTTTRLATATAMVTTALLLPFGFAAHAAAPPARVIPVPEGCTPPAPLVRDVDDRLAERKAAWAADRIARRLL